MKKILLKRCEADEFDNYYYQGFAYIYKFEHDPNTNIVSIFKNGIYIRKIYTEEELSKFITTLGYLIEK